MRNEKKIGRRERVSFAAKWLCFSFLIFHFSFLSAQEATFNAVCQQRAILPNGIEAVMVMDGELYCYASGVLLKAERNGETVTALLPDTVFSDVAPGATYVVRHPSGDLYFTKPDRKGRSSLAVLHNREGKKPKVSQVKMEGMSVEHPAFTADGRIMVFASRDGHSSGGSDLWYSLFDGQSWGKPINLGNRLNTKDDEFAPTIYRDYLLFTSNGRDGRIHLYSTRLISDMVTGDTIGMLQIGRSPVQQLPEPINMGMGGDCEIAIDTMRNCGYWVSTRSGEPRLYAFSGALDGVVMWGYVKNKLGQRMPGVRIALSAMGGEGASGTLFTTMTDSLGFYRVYLRSGQSYSISYRIDDYFTRQDTVTMPKSNVDRLVIETQHEVVMDNLPLGQRIYFNDLFGPDADIELSERGKRELQSLVRFLRDNPQMNVTMSLSCNLTDDDSFNSLLAQQRILSLQNHLYGLIPASVQLRFTDGDASAPGSAAGVSRLAVVIKKR